MQFQRFASFTPRADFARLEAALSPPAPPEAHEGSWYEIQNARGDDAEVFIYGPIGDYGVEAATFVREFASIRAQRITIRVNSPGGNAIDGFALYNAIARHPAQTTAYVDGTAASAASYIILGAKRVVAAKRSTLMIHKASAFAYGNADDMAQMQAVLSKFDSEIASVYVDKAGGLESEWLERMAAETWLTAAEALALGLVDEIDGVEPSDVAPQPVNQAPEAPATQPTEPVPAPVKFDWHAALEEIADEAFHSQFANEEATP